MIHVTAYGYRETDEAFGPVGQERFEIRTETDIVGTLTFPTTVWKEMGEPERISLAFVPAPEEPHLVTVVANVPELPTDDQIDAVADAVEDYARMGLTL